MPIAKLFYVQNVLRFSEGDDSREDWQCGAELIGDTYPLGDIELILIDLRGPPAPRPDARNQAF